MKGDLKIQIFNSKNIISLFCAQTVGMKNLYRTLSAMCATIFCLFLPMTTACSRLGQKDSSSDPPSSSNSEDSSMDARRGHPSDFSDYFPDLMSETIPYPIFPRQDGELEGIDHTEPPAPPTLRPRAVKPAHPGVPNGTDKMPSPMRPHKDGHPDSYQKDSGADDKGSCTSDYSTDENCSDSEHSDSEHWIHPRHGVRPHKNNRQGSN